MSAARRFALLLLALPLVLLTAPAPGTSRPLPGATVERDRTLSAIAAWLREAGEEGAMGADVANALEVPRLVSGTAFGARQLAFRSGDTLYLAQVLAGPAGDYLLFMVERTERIVFYLSTPADGLRKAILSVPGRHLVIPLYGSEAEVGFRDAVAYWRARLGDDR